MNMCILLILFGGSGSWRVLGEGGEDDDVIKVPGYVAHILRFFRYVRCLVIFSSSSSFFFSIDSGFCSPSGMPKLLCLFTFYDSSLASDLFFVVPLTSQHVMYVAALWIVVCSDSAHACGLWLFV